MFNLFTVLLSSRFSFIHSFFFYHEIVTVLASWIIFFFFFFFKRKDLEICFYSTLSYILKSDTFSSVKLI